MKPRERVLIVLNHQEPDRVSVDLGGMTTTLMVGIYERLKEFLGVKTETKILSKQWQLAKIDEEILTCFFPQVDFRHVYAGGEFLSSKEMELGDGSYVDEWGVTRKKILSYYEIVDYPLRGATLKDLEDYDWPDPLDQGRLKGLKEEVEKLHQNADYAIVGHSEGESIFEQSWYLRGYEDFLMDLVSNKEFAHALLRRVTDIQKAKVNEFYKAIGDNIDIITAGDDLATQQGPVISPSTYREMVKPYQAELFETMKRGYKVKLWYHSCGSIYHLIGDLLEIGVDILNPVQVAASDMDTKRLKKEFGDRLSFWGAIDTQRVMPYGSPDGVRKEVERRINDLAPGGGYILASVHTIQNDVPPENIIAMFEAAKEYGKY